MEDCLNDPQLDTTELDPIISEAAEWTLRLENPTTADIAELLEWLTKSPRHGIEFCAMLAIAKALRIISPSRLRPNR